MALCAEDALLAAIEIYNKPRVAYREQTLALLLVNAWEILLKARVVQIHGNNLAAIYRRERGSKRFRKARSGRILTVSLREAAEKAQVANEVRSNLEGLCEIRDEAAHLGNLGTEFREQTLKLGSAAVRNFVVAVGRWFGRQVEAPHFLPLGFLSQADLVKPANVRQRELLDYLRKLTSDQTPSNSGFTVSLRVDVLLNPEFSGGGTIGVTNNPAAPKVHLTDTQALERYPLTYEDLVEECRALIPNLKQNQSFHEAMKTVKSDANHALERRLNPQKPGGTRKFFYARTAAGRLRHLLRGH